VFCSGYTPVGGVTAGVNQNVPLNGYSPSSSAGSSSSSSTGQTNPPGPSEGSFNGGNVNAPSSFVALLIAIALVVCVTLF
jgi:hypothetical protein